MPKIKQSPSQKLRSFIQQLGKEKFCLHIELLMCVPYGKVINCESIFRAN